MNRWWYTKYLTGFGTCLILLTLFVNSTRAAAGDTTRVSVASDGAQGNGDSYSVRYNNSISADGRYVAFSSAASNLVSGDTNGFIDIFVYDQQNGQTKRVSVGSNGEEGNGDSTNPTISGDGRYVAFSSVASNLVSGDSNGYKDVFIFDQQNGQTKRISVATNGTQGNQDSDYPSFSKDGNFVAYYSLASNLVSGDTNGFYDVFVYNQQTAETELISEASNGTHGNNSSGSPSISNDGRYVAFSSNATNLVSGDTNNSDDVFVHDRQTGETRRVSIASDGTQGNSHSGGPTISADGRYIAFWANASNLVSGDTNANWDVFIHDMQTGQTKRVSVGSDGTQGSDSSSYPSISEDGRFVAFETANALVSEDSNNTSDIYVQDQWTGRTTRISVSSTGTQANNFCVYPSISGDGRYVAFQSYASNLVSGDTNGFYDVFVHENNVPIWTISGNIVDASSNGIAGANISDGAGHTTITDSNGNYTFNDLSTGSYAISATMPGHEFWPPSRSVSLTSSNATGQNFSEWIDAVHAPLYLQTDPAWNKPNQFYDGTANTIYNLGCALSSDAMVLSYYGQFYSPPFQTDPGALNTALNNFPNGYDQEGGVEPISFQSYAWLNGVLLSVTSVGQDNTADRQKLDQYLGSENLAIFQVASPFSPSGVHFVVVTGKTMINGQSTYTLNDPYYGYTTLQTYNNQFQYVFYYVTALTSSTYHRSLEISAHSPVQLVVADALGRRVGYDPRTDETYNEIPDAGYITGAIAGPDGNTLPDEKYVLIPQPNNGTYSVQVIGDGSGSYTVNVLQTDASGNTSLDQETGTAQPDSVDTYTVLIPYYLYLPLIIP